MTKLFKNKYKYKYRNIIIILLFVLVVSVICIFTILNIVNTHNSNKKVMSTESRMKITKFETSINLSKQLINSARFSNEAKEWANSYVHGHESYSLIKFMWQLNKELTILTSAECYIGAWKLGTQNTSVFFDGATISEKKLFDSILGVEESSKNEILEQLRLSGEYVISYDETEKHEYFIKLYYEKYSGGEIVYFTLVPFKILDDENATWFLTYADKLIGTNNKEEYLKQKSNYKNKLFLQNEYTETSSNGLIYTYEKDSIAIYYILIIIFVIIIISTIILFLILKITSVIYEPINMLIDEFGLENKSKYINEIKLFEESMIAVNLLNNKLESIKEDISMQTNERKYLNLLMGYKEDIDYGISNFCISLLEFDEFDDSDKIFYAINDLQVYASKNKSIIFIRLDKLHVLFIHKTDSYKSAEEILTHIILNYTNDVTVKIALTDVYNSIEEISVAYELVYKILNYKYYFQEKDIILFSDISNLVFEDYNFSINIENQLIYLVLKGDEKALDIFDKFVDENIRNPNISSNNTENYILVLINMVNRIFAEIKIAPLDLVGYDILFTEWICLRNNPNIIYILRNTLRDIIINMNSKSEKNKIGLMEKILDYIHANYMKDIMLVDINTEFAISPQRVNALFKEELGSNFKTYLNEYRIKMAQEIQLNDKNIKTAELSELVGFNSATSFIRVYKKYTGISPQEYQKTL